MFGRVRKRRTALAAVGAVVSIAGTALMAAAGGSWASDANAAAAFACRVDYTTNDWGGDFSATITVRNTGTAALSGWTLRFAFPDAGQRVTQGWSATWSQSGTAVTAANAAWNGALPAGASIGLGFNGTYSGTNPRPASFTLNGAPCTAG